MIKALIFDLDNCLASAKEVGEQLYQPAFEAIRQANRDNLSAEILEEAFAECWRHPLDWVAARYGFTHTMLKAGWRVFETLKVNHPMQGYGDLEFLSELSAMRFLVTSGFRCLQESKIKALNLAPLFTATYVDAIDHSVRLGKQPLFERILQEHSLTPAEVFAIGDNADAEIEIGNRLGMKTVQTLRPAVPRASNATFHIHSLEELAGLLRDHV